RSDYIRYGLDVIGSAQKGSRGGLMIDALAGFAGESIGQQILARSRDKLTADECSALVTALEAIDESREPVARVVQRDRAWYRSSKNLANRVMPAATPGATRLFQASSTAFELASRRMIARLHLLIAELAIRRYRLENGVNPPSLEAMVPRYLARVPLDPYS